MSNEKSTQLHQDSVVINCLDVSDWDSEEVLKGLHSGGVTATNATIAISENFVETLDIIAQWHAKLERYGDILAQVSSVDDINRCNSEGKAGVIFGFQNSGPVEDDVRRLRVFKRLGVRIIQLTYNYSNLSGGGYAEKPDYGLTILGKELIDECNRLGILIDLSHVNYQTTMDAIEASSKPVAFTHVGPRALFEHRRNKTDEQLLALAKKGGVAGANAETNFMAAWKNATIDDYVDNIDYMVRLMGIDHVGIGTDFTLNQTPSWFRRLFTGRNTDKQVEYPKEFRTEGEGEIILAHYPKDLASAADFPNLTAALLKRYSEEDTRKILGGNFLRLFSEVWL
ncbi:dipeptidase [Chloroflexota bacterium]